MPNPITKAVCALNAHTYMLDGLPSVLVCGNSPQFLLISPPSSLKSMPVIQGRKSCTLFGFVFSVLVWIEIIREDLEAILRQALIHTRLGKVSLLELAVG